MIVQGFQYQSLCKMPRLTSESTGISQCPVSRSRMQSCRAWSRASISDKSAPVSIEVSEQEKYKWLTCIYYWLQMHIHEKERGNDVVPAALILCAGVLHIGFLFMCLPLDQMEQCNGMQCKNKKQKKKQQLELFEA